MNHVTSAPDCDPDYDSPPSHQVNLKMVTKTKQKFQRHVPGGFAIGRAPSAEVGCQPIILTNFPQNYMKMKKILIGELDTSLAPHWIRQYHHSSVCPVQNVQGHFKLYLIEKLRTNLSGFLLTVV